MISNPCVASAARRSWKWPLVMMTMTLLGVVGTSAARAQVKIQNAAGDDGAAGDAVDPGVGLFPADREHLVNLSRAEQLIEDREFAEAITLLHDILANDEERALVADKDRTMLRNLRLEAERLLGGMPGDALQTYDRFYDADARRMLLSAIDRFDLDALAATSRQYFYTSSGCEATHLLATAYLDQGRPMDAAAWFERLRNRRLAAKSGRDVLTLQTAMAWALAGVPSMAKARLLELKSLAPGEPIVLGEQKLKLFDDDEKALAWLYEAVLGLKAPVPARADSEPIAGADFVSQVNWKISTSSWQTPVAEAPFSGGVVDVSRQLTGLDEEFRKQQLAAIPCTRPLIVDGTALVRTHSRLEAYDLASGELIWKTNGVNLLEEVRRGALPPLPGDTGSILDPMLKDRLYVNASYGNMTIHDRLVYCLEDLGFQIPLVGYKYRPASGNQSVHPLATKAHNRLCAYDVANGRLAWNVGGESDAQQPELAEHYFLGAPLPLAGHVYCLAETNQQIHLVVLDARTGKLDWTKPLQSVAIDVTQDEHRGRAGLCPSYAEGVLVCPTGSGLVVGVDLATRQLMWSYRYRDLDEGTQQEVVRRFLVMRMAAAGGNPPTGETKKGEWHDSTARIVDQRVVVTIRDSEELLCLDLLNGELLWKRPKENREFVVGETGGKLLVVGNQFVELLQLANGEAVWDKPLDIGAPSGRGMLVGHQYSVPLGAGAIATIDLDKRQIIASVKSADGQFVPGNLLYGKGFVLSQGPSGIVCFRPPTRSE